MANHLDRNVRELMTAPASLTTPETSLLDAGRQMLAAGHSCLLVDLGDPGLGFGIVTHKDIVMRIGVDTSDVITMLGDACVSDVMTAPTVTVPPDYKLSTCLDLMRMLGVRRAPVIEDGKVLGIISLTDFFKAAMAL